MILKPAVPIFRIFDYDQAMAFYRATPFAGRCVSVGADPPVA